MSLNNLFTLPLVHTSVSLSVFLTTSFFTSPVIDEIFDRGRTRTHDLHSPTPCHPDEPLRIMGDVYGTLNGFTIEGQQIQAYAVVSDGRSYTSVAKIVPELGYDLQSLMPVSDIVGWMFAKPAIGVRNGFQMTGECCHIGEKGFC